MDTFTRVSPAESKPSATTGRGALVPAGLAGAGISLIVVVGLIHLINSPEDLEEGAYTGVLYLANFFGALAAAVGIYRGKRWGWALGFLVAGGAFAGSSPWECSLCWSRVCSWVCTWLSSPVPKRRQG
jgi:hypothetical protein